MLSSLTNKIIVFFFTSNIRLLPSLERRNVVRRKKIGNYGAGCTHSAVTDDLRLYLSNVHELAPNKHDLSTNRTILINFEYLKTVVTKNISEDNSRSKTD